MNFQNFTLTQWLNVAMFALGSFAMAGWWQDLMSPTIATAVTGGLVWVNSLLNFVVSGAAPTTPKA